MIFGHFHLITRVYSEFFQDDTLLDNFIQVRPSTFVDIIYLICSLHAGRQRPDDFYRVISPNHQQNFRSSSLSYILIPNYFQVLYFPVYNLTRYQRLAASNESRLASLRIQDSFFAI